MKLARCIISGKRIESNLSRLLNQAEPDVLQLDWFHEQPAEAWNPQDIKFTTGGVREEFKIVHKALYLRPQLRVATNIGGLNVVGAMEALAEFLSEHGSPDMPIAAIRGENVLADIDDFLPAMKKIDLANVLSAQVEIGGGPFATALVEGARIVVAGAYDLSAPFLAAAVSEGLCGWDDKQFLGKLTAASQFVDLLVEAFADGRIELDQGASGELFAPVAENACSKFWNMRLTMSEGFRATVLIEMSSVQLANLREFCRDQFSEQPITIKKFVPTGRAENEGDLLVRLEYQANSRETCQQFVDSLQFWLRQHSDGTIVAPLPSIQLFTKTMLVPVAAERIVLSVDTRPAREWL
ncbi:MAG: acyclic terpene utilization AtuA family protein [Bythopirellula sp.]|nr:acyclic terpene utilization AtuA family protein [Bythopirellula sp.]